jgi:hypothetical protein
MYNLGKDGQYMRAIAPTAAGAADVNGTVIDTQGAEEITFVLLVGDGVATGTIALQVQTGTLANGTDMADVAGCVSATLTSDGTSTDNKILVVQAIKPLKRYARMVAKRAVANHVIDGGVAILTGFHQLPAPAGDTVSRVVANG